jgi:hypothetical protein
MVTEVALDTFQLKVAELPVVIVPGLAVKESITGAPADGTGADAPVTITWVVAVTLPAGLMALRV